MNELALRGQLDPCMSRAFTYEQLPDAHQLMADNKHPHGNMSVLIGATEFGLGASGKPAVIMVHPTLPKGDVHTTPHPYPMSEPLPSIEQAEAITIADDGSKVRDLMHAGIISCTPDDTVGTVAKIMVDKEIHAAVSYTHLDVYKRQDRPPLGEIPEKMHAWLIRADRFGKPMEAFQKEVVNTPSIADDEVLVYVMAAGINYNNVWAAMGIPVNVIGARNKGGEPEDFHIGGSDASGIVYKAVSYTHLDVYKRQVSAMPPKPMRTSCPVRFAVRWRESLPANGEIPCVRFSASSGHRRVSTFPSTAAKYWARRIRSPSSGRESPTPASPWDCLLYTSRCV